MIRWPDSSTQQYQSANCTCILTPNSPPICGKENLSDSENLLHCIRYFSSQADILKEAVKSIKSHRVRCQNVRMIHALILPGQ